MASSSSIPEVTSAKPQPKDLPKLLSQTDIMRPSVCDNCPVDLFLQTCTTQGCPHGRVNLTSLYPSGF